jgi:putative ABC transport system permease protein
MLLSALDRKLLREVRRMKGQVITIALVLASGISSFVALRGTYASILQARDDYYDRARFAHVFATLERAPEELARRLEAVPGVALLETRIAEDVMLPLEGMERPATGRLLSVPAGRAPATNALVLRAGRLPERGRDDEALLLESFAHAHGLQPGSRLPAVINGKLRRLQVVGVVLSPEYVYALRPGAMADDPQRFAVMWMERTALADAFRLEGAFNEVSARLQPGASEAAVRAAFDRLLVPYGGNGAIGRKDQTSNRIVTGEIGQLQALAGMVPMVFLGVAAFLINLVLGRLITLQRTEIAVLKAVGYRNREVGRHYLGLVLVVLLPGAALGALGGWALGRTVLGWYAAVFRFADLSFGMSLPLIATACLVSLGAALLGALLAVRRATRLPPAEAMQPAAPARYRRTLLERLGLGALAGPQGLMVLREVTRRPLRTLLSSLGIAGAVALVILGRFGADSVDAHLEGTVRREQRQDLAVTFLRPVSPRAAVEVLHLPGVLRAEPLRAVPVRVRNGHRARDSVLTGLPAHATLRRLVQRGGPELPVPGGGVLMTDMLAQVLGLRVGDRVELGLREGERQTVSAVVLGLVDEAVGLQVYTDAETVAALSGDRGAVSSLLLTVDPPRRAALEERLRRAPRVLDVSDLRADIDRLRDMQGSIIDLWTVVSIVLATAVIFGVVYNNARIALATRSRELASLRVLGFSRREISAVLVGGLAIEVLVAIPIGLVLGRLWGNLFMQSVDRETFRWLVVVAPRTYALAAAVALLAATSSALWVRRSLDRLDLIGVLKTRE